MRGLNVVLDVRGTWCRGVSPFHAGIILQLDWICADRLMARTRRSAFILSLRTLVIGVDVEDVAMYRMLISLVHEPMSNQQFLQLRLKVLATQIAPLSCRKSRHRQHFTTRTAPALTVDVWNWLKLVTAFMMATCSIRAHRSLLVGLPRRHLNRRCHVLVFVAASYILSKSAAK